MGSGSNRGRPGLTWLWLATLLGCSTAARPTRIIMATTTSVEDSGLLQVLVPAFETVHPEYEVHYTAVGSGQALELGRRGDADILITHSEADELRFMADGHGSDRRSVMSNEFVVLGPPADPAGVRTARDAADAFRRIAGAGSRFVSRGDQSGTHRREMSVWTAAQVEPGGAWYMEAGVGMGDALGIAAERRAYILSDIATYLFARDRFDLDLLYRGDPRLLNQYSVIRTARAANAAGAAALADWLVGEQAQDLIAEFGLETVGPLFKPNPRTE